MRVPQLRVYYGPEDQSAEATPASHQSAVTVLLTEILPLLADAYNSRRAWWRDFADDEVTISADLYEVLLAYQHYRRPSA